MKGFAVDKWLPLRFLPLIVVPLVLLASEFPGRYTVPAPLWLLSLAAAASFVLGYRWPLAVCSFLSVLAVAMFASHSWGLADFLPYLTAVALADVAMRRGRGQVAIAGASWTVALIVGSYLKSPDQFWRISTALTVVAFVAAPILLGLYVQALRALADTYRMSAADAEARARATERGNIARELHDVVAHHMSSLILRVSVARHVTDGLDPRVGEVLADVQSTATSALADIRRLLAALRDPDAEGVLVIDPDSARLEIDAAIDRTRATGFVVNSNIDDHVYGADAMRRLTLLRVVQESLANVMKHADARVPVELSITKDDSSVHVKVLSGGSRRATSPGYGTVGMRERVSLAAGQLFAGPTPNGWLVEGWLPIDSEVAEIRAGSS